MYKSSKQIVEKNTFYVELLDERTDREINLSVFPPKLKTLNKLKKIDTQGDDCIDELAEALAKLLNSNKEKVKLTADDVLEILDTEDMANLMSEYVDWANALKKN